MSKRDSILLSLGRNVRRLREARKITQEKLAARSGIHPTYISDIERGTRIPGIKNVAPPCQGARRDNGGTVQGGGCMNKSKERGSPDPQQVRPRRMVRAGSKSSVASGGAAARESRAPELHDQSAPYCVTGESSPSPGGSNGVRADVPPTQSPASTFSAAAAASPSACSAPASACWQRFWRKKLAANQARDARVNRALRAAGWRVVRVWEHELKRGGRNAEGGTPTVVRRIQRGLRPRRGHD